MLIHNGDIKEIKSDIYHLLHPKMTFFLTSISPPQAGEKPNVMTCTWATPVSEEPPVVIVCVSIECKLWKTVNAGECYALFGKVLSAYADERYFKKGLWTEKAEIPFHLGGSKMVYFREKD